MASIYRSNSIETKMARPSAEGRAIYWLLVETGESWARSKARTETQTSSAGAC